MRKQREELKSRKFDAVGLLQTTVAGVLYYADRAFKTSNVFPVEINGSYYSISLRISFLGGNDGSRNSNENVDERKKKEKIV